MADPIYENDLVLLSTFIKHDDLAREAECTYAVADLSLNLSAQEWADAAQTNWTTNLISRLDSNAQVMRTVALKGDGTSVFTTGESSAAPTRGTASFSSVPSNCAQLVRKITPFGGRRNRGRMYLPWSINEGLVNEIGIIDPGFTADTQAALDDWLGDFGGTLDPHLVIANRTYDRAWDVPNRKLVSVTISPGFVNAVPVDAIMATQRRRMPRH